MEQPAVVVKQRTWVPMAALATLCAGYLLLRRAPWLGSTELHTLMELLATTLALFVGCLAFLRFYSKKNNTFLFEMTTTIGASWRVTSASIPTCGSVTASARAATSGP